MWLIKVFGVITAFTALRAADPVDDAFTVLDALPETTLLPMLSVTPTLSLDSPGQIYPGERISLTCSASGSSPDWTYQWFHLDQRTPLQSSDPNSTSYTINSVVLTDNGLYWCRIKRREQDESVFSNAISLSVTEPPNPSVEKQTHWSDVFPSEKVELSCGLHGSSDWTFTWYRDGQALREDATVSLAADGSTLTLTPASQTYSGNYVCKGHHKTKLVITGDSNPLPLQVYANKPKPIVTQTPRFDKMYVGEPVSFSCMVDMSSGWEYLWYKDKEKLQTTQNYILNSPNPSNSGQYWCQAKRGKAPFYTEKSETAILQFSDPPKPSLALQTRWLDVFPSEEVELSCGIGGSSDWTFTWYRNGQELQSDSTMSLGAGGSSLTIHSATQTHQGPYTCEGHHKTRKISSGLSDTADITVYENKPKPTLSKDPGFQQIYAGEAVSFSCRVSVSSGWEYQWYKDGEQLTTSDTSNTSYTISRATPSDGGIYTCKATRGKPTFFTVNSETLTISDPPKPSLELQTRWLDVFPSERVELSCGVQGSSDWTYTWYRDRQKLNVDQNVSIGAEGSTFTMISAKQEYTGGYTCKAQHKIRRVITESSMLLLNVDAKKPKPLMTQDPSVQKLYTGESVSFGCQVDVSSGWEYLWYKNGKLFPTRGNSFNISFTNLSDSGTYWCVAVRGKTTFNTESSEVQTLRISEIPVPSLKLNTLWLDVFPTESVELSCGIQSSSDWTYKWYRGAQELQGDKSMSLGLDGATLSIHSASDTHPGKYRCWGQHKSRSVTTKTSSELALKVYDKLPKTILMQKPEYKEMYVGESLSFSCEVNVSSGWEYLLNKDGKQLTMSGNSYYISSAVSTNTGAYKCQAKRGQKAAFSTDLSQALNLDIQVRPWAVMTLLTGWSEVFSTDSLVLKCEVHESQDFWNYTWFREGQEINLAHSEKHTVTPQDDPDQSQYTCKGTRTGRPSYSTLSEPFKTRNLLLKRRVLLSISGCIFFGIIAVFIGCIVLRVTHKPDDAAAENPEEYNLFPTMAELKARDDAPCPLADYITEAALTAPTKDGDDNGTICSESTPLPITTQEDQAVTSESPDTADNNGGLMSFK